LSSNGFFSDYFACPFIFHADFLEAKDHLSEKQKVVITS